VNGTNDPVDEHEPTLVTVTAFGHTFEDILPENGQTLKTLESEGAVYSEFADETAAGSFTGSFTRYRIEFTPAEIVEYVEASKAAQEFQKALKLTRDFTAAVLGISEPRFRNRVASYGNYGRSRTEQGEVEDIRGCLASFMGEDLEDLLCGHRPDRYVQSPSLGDRSNQNELVLRALKSVAVNARKLSNRSHGRPDIAVTSEYDIQDLDEMVLTPLFADVKREEWTPQIAGTAKRMDIVVPSLSTVIECKYIRDSAHARKVVDELKIDFESYHEYSGCRELIVYIYDPDNHIVDPERFIRDLSGLRQKAGHMFTVHILVN
jgi:REase_DpnII-MboI